MSLEYLLYVSLYKPSPRRAPNEIGRLVNHAREANARNGLSGTLIFTGTRFAQFLEGPHQNLARVMYKILADERHNRITVLRRDTSRVRRFDSWSLSYSGPSLYVDRQLESLVGKGRELHGHNHEREVDQLLRLMVIL
ncbi:BLUF domain-containing protein [Sphingomonas sediminicola]|uniref:BLUF domain-containing protein n=1 Tax=Sphingomonas TaxID=13687 RepID=UPI003B5881C7